MKPLYLYGCGGLGLTLIEIHRRGGLERFELAGWIDDGRDATEDGPEGLPIVGGREFLRGLDAEHAVVIAIGDDRVRLELGRTAANCGIEQPVAIHPEATLFEDVLLGPGSIINAGAIIARHTCLGPNSIVNLAATVGHDVVGGTAVQISPGVNIAGAVVIGRGVFMGPGAVVIQGLRIGDWSRVGAGAVVIRDVEPHTTVFGNPARVIERREDPDATTADGA